MVKKNLNKAMAAALSAAMVVGTAPATAFAVTGDQVAADGTYTATGTVETDDSDEWSTYNINVSVVVKDGKFDSITATGATDDSTAYLNRAVSKKTGISTVLAGKDATANNVDAWDTVSGATIASNAVKKAVQTAIASASEKQETVAADRTALTAAIEKAAALTESDYTADSWSALQTALTAAQSVAEDADQTAVDAAAGTLNAAIDALVKAETPAAEDTYVMMNIPFNVFYGLVGAGDVDVTSSATAKVRNSGVAGATYNGEGSVTSETKASASKGVQFAVKVADASLLNDAKYTEVTDETSYHVVYSGRGLTTEADVAGKDALIQAGDYAYYKLSETPSNYVELAADGTFSGVQGATTAVAGSTEDITYGSHWGSYLVDFSGKISGKVAGVVVKTDKLTFGLKPTDYIWRSMEIAWSPEDELAATNGAALQSVTVYTDAGVYEISYDNLTLKKVSDEAVSAGLAGSDGQVNGLPSDITNPVATISYTTGTGRAAVTTKVVENVKTAGGIFEIPSDVSLEEGKEYTVTVSSDNYLDLSATATYSTAASQYVLMNIPYSVFNNLIGAGNVDVTSSATAKVRNSGVAGATYNGGGNATNTEDVTDTTKGVQFAVKVTDASLLNSYTKVTSDTSYDIAYSGRGRTTNATLSGRDALIQAPDYAYVSLAIAPANYVELTSDGFSDVKGEVISNDDTKSEVEYGSHWGTYLFDLNGISGRVAAVKVTTDKLTFALKPTDYIWRSMEIAWSPEDDLAATNGATVNTITVYTDAGVYDITVNQKLKTLSENEVTATLKDSTGELSGLPDDIENPKAKVYTPASGRGESAVAEVDYVTDAEIKDGSFTIPSDAKLKAGKEYTVTVSSDNYTDFTVTAAYSKTNADGDGTSETDPAANFTDVSSDAFYYDALNWAVTNGITAGTTATTFSPDAATTRGQMVQFLYRMAGSPDVSGSIPFTDVDSDAYYYNAVIWAYQNGITTGTTATTFSPNEDCARGQMVQFLYKYATLKGLVSDVEDENPFTDVDESAYYYTAVEWAYQSEVTAGTTDTTYSPKANCTRGQMVQFLYKLSLLK